jgi:hypothetical protein
VFHINTYTIFSEKSLKKTEKKLHEISENFMQKIQKNPKFLAKNPEFPQICVYQYQYPCDINYGKLPFQ